MRSIRRTLVTGTTAGALTVLTIGGVVLHRRVDATLSQERDRALRDTVEFLASTITTSVDGVEVELDELGLHELEREEERSALSVWNVASGEVLYTSPTGAAPLEPAAAPGGTGFRDGRSPLGRPVRSVTHRFTPRIDVDEEEDDPEEVAKIVSPEIAIVLARDSARLDALLSRLGALLASVGLGVGALVVGVILTVVRRGLGPLGRLARRIDAVDVDGTHAPISLEGAPIELQRVIERLNALVLRVGEAIARERTFSADIAHELRTPLAGLRTTIEVELSRPRSSEDYIRALEASLGIVTRLQSMTDTLLHLCRLEAGAVAPRRAGVDLGHLVADAWSARAEFAERRDLRVERSVREGVIVTTDAGLLEAAVRNLLDNAVSHADRGGRVSIDVRANGSAGSLSIANSGSQVDRDEVPALFERFGRGDRARGDTGAHAGLGLTLVRRIAMLLDLELAVDAKRGGEFRVTLGAPAIALVIALALGGPVRSMAAEPEEAEGVRQEMSEQHDEDAGGLLERLGIGIEGDLEMVASDGDGELTFDEVGLTFRRGLVQAELGAVVSTGEGVSVAVENAWLAIGGTERWPVRVTFGRLVLPFGRYEGEFVENPLTTALGESDDAALSLELISRSWRTSLTGFTGVHAERGEVDWIVTTSFEPADAWLARISWSGDLAESVELRERLRAYPQSPESAEEMDAVRGLGVYLQREADRVVTRLEVVTAVERFQRGVVDANRRHPWAWGGEVAFRAGERITLAGRIEGSRDLPQLPDVRYGGSMSVALTPWLGAAFDLLRAETWGERPTHLLSFQLGFEL